jgi:hypothetical protein
MSSEDALAATVPIATASSELLLVHPAAGGTLALDEEVELDLAMEENGVNTSWRGAFLVSLGLSISIED